MREGEGVEAPAHRKGQVLMKTLPLPPQGDRPVVSSALPFPGAWPLLGARAGVRAGRCEAAPCPPCSLCACTAV